jgi:hypothetical protein
MTSYSQALEVQHAVRRLLASAGGRAYLTGLLEDARYRAGISGEWTPATIGDVMAYGVEHGEPYYWSPDICRLVATAAETVPDYRLERTVLPGEAGYFHLASPLPLPPREVGPSDLAGVGWFWSPGDDRLQVTYYVTDFLPTHPGVPTPVSTAAWMVGQTWREALGYLTRVDIVASYPNRAELMLRYVAACLAFIEQPYFGTERVRPERATRKRLAPGWDGDVPSIQVVQLRRPLPSGSGHHDDPRGAEWSCQWPVRPHWRMQACGEGRVERRPVLVRGYIKGDPSKPLKAAAERLFAVVR